MIAQARYIWPGVMLSMMLAGHALASTPSRVMHPHDDAKHDDGRNFGDRAGGTKATPQADRGHHGGGTKAIVSKANSTKGGAVKLALANPRHRPQVHLASLHASERPGAFASMPRERHEGGEDYVGAYEPASDGHQVGIASWYGGKQWNGHRTSDGGRFSDTELTAAHATLPLGSMVRVTLSSSERSVVVRINDRPGTRRRIIDLSRAAAAELGMLGAGTAVVMLSPL